MDMQKWATQAASRTPRELSRLVSHASKIGSNASALAAPVYDKPRWTPTVWRHYRHHINARPGNLKRTMRAKPTRRTGVGRFKGGFGSSARYASFVDRGFIHWAAKRPVPGRKFMKVGEIHAELYLNVNTHYALARIIKP